MSPARTSIFTFISVLVSTAAWATPLAPPADHFAPTWSASPSDHFTPADRPLAATIAKTHDGIVAGDILVDAFASAADATFRHDLAINEMTSEWSSTQRIALEDLRDAQRRYAAAAGGDADARSARFTLLLRQVVDGSGRSAAKDAPDADAVLGTTYERVMRDAPDEALPELEAAEKAWTTYRDAFDRFAQAMDRPDAARTVHDDLARRRVDELQAISAQ